MTLPKEAYYSAVKAHDRRFDGTFFTCVLTTNIYCRPICTAPLPQLRNCRFVSSAAEAERQGFRPCLRCRPERAPGLQTTAFSPAHSLATHIDRTLLSDETLQDAAQTIGTSERHLRRQFAEAYGVEPKAYLTTRRLLFAKQLLQDTAMPVMQVAYASGFGSIDSLTTHMKRAYNLTPGSLRKRVAAGTANTSAIVLKTDYRPPFDWELVLQFLAGRATPKERVEHGVYYRSVDNGLEIAVRNSPQKSQLLITIPAEVSRHAYAYLQCVRHVFDLDANPTEISDVLTNHPVVGALIARYPGVRVPGCWDSFEMMVRVVIGQQISVSGATTIMRRFIERIGITPPEVAASSPAAIAAIGMPRKRAETLWRLGQLVHTKALNLNEANPQLLYDALVAQPGIGPWTAEYLLMRALHWPDALPAADLGLQKAVNPGQRVTAQQVIAQLESVRPWRSYATILLWKSLDNKGG